MEGKFFLFLKLGLILVSYLEVFFMSLFRKFEGDIGLGVERVVFVFLDVVRLGRERGK